MNKEIPNDHTYKSIFKDFLLSIIDTDISNINLLDEIINGCKNFSIKAFEGIDKETSIKIYGFIQQYADILKIDTEKLKKIELIMKEKLQNDEMIIINATINHLLKHEIYVLNHKEEVFYIPLWHDELTYTLEKSSLIIKCNDELPEHITIDNNNNLHINITSNISTLLNKNFYLFQ